MQFYVKLKYSGSINYFSLQARIEEMPLEEESPEEKFDWDQFNDILLQALKVFVPVKQQN